MNDEPSVLFTNERDAPPVGTQPLMKVHSWRLMKATTGELHLVTLRVRHQDHGTVRLTSALVSIDKTTRVVVTSSGRRYALLAAPESGALEQQVLRAGAARLGLAGAVDISDWAWAQVRAH